MAENQYVLTQEGKESLLKRLDILLEEKTQALAELNFARSQGDLSENSDYDAASLGTSFVVDGAPVSTEANMQYVQGNNTGQDGQRQVVN